MDLGGHGRDVERPGVRRRGMDVLGHVSGRQMADGGNVFKPPLALLRLGIVVGVDIHSQGEVRELEQALSINQDGARLQVVVHDAVAVEELKGREQVEPHHIHRLLRELQIRLDLQPHELQPT